MPGELWREQWNVGKEVTFGVPVVPTHAFYVANPSLTRERNSNLHRFMTGTRQNALAHTLGPIQVGGSVQMPLSSQEIVEMLLCSLQGGVTPSTPGTAPTAKLWTFTPGNTLDSMTVERYDGARWWLGSGIMFDQITIAGSVQGDNTITGTIFGADLEPLDLPSTAPASRTPTFVEGWETNLYIDSFTTADGASRTLVSDLLINWNVSLRNQLSRKYTARNALTPSDLPSGVLEVTAQLMFEARNTNALTEYLNWDGQVYRLVRLEFGQNKEIDAGTNQVWTLTIGSGPPISGNFTLIYNGIPTRPIPWNATAAVTQSALRAHPNFGYNDVTVTGTQLPAGSQVITFQNAKGSQVVTLTANAAGLSPSSTVGLANTTPGVAGYNRFTTLDIPGAWSANAISQSEGATRTYQMTLQGLYDPTTAYGFQVRCQNDLTAAWA